MIFLKVGQMHSPTVTCAKGEEKYVISCLTEWNQVQGVDRTEASLIQKEEAERLLEFINWGEFYFLMGGNSFYNLLQLLPTYSWSSPQTLCSSQLCNPYLAKVKTTVTNKWWKARLRERLSSQKQMIKENISEWVSILQIIQWIFHHTFSLLGSL